MLRPRVARAALALAAFRSHSTAAKLTALRPLGPIATPQGMLLDDAALAERVEGKSVALYFGAGWCPACTRFEPSLHLFREACEQSGRPVELMYVSSDGDAAVQQQRAALLSMAQVEVPDAIAALKERFGVWAGREMPQFGVGRRSGIPALVVLTTSGEVRCEACNCAHARSLFPWHLPLRTCPQPSFFLLTCMRDAGGRVH